MKWLLRCLLFSLLIIKSLPECKSQVLDTIEYSLKQKPSFFFNLSAFNSSVSNEMANFFGFKTGLNYNKRVKFGIGFYGLTSNVVSSIVINSDTSYTTNGELKLNFLSLSSEYIFYIKYPWQFSVTPIQFSIGEGHYRYISEPDKLSLKTKKQFVLLYEPNVVGQFSLFRWLGLAAGLGYRVKIFSSDQLNEDLSAPTYTIGFRIFIDELYKMAFPNGAFNKSMEKN